MNTKETTYQKALVTNLVLFVRYGCFIGFAFGVLVIIIKCLFINISSTPISVTLSLISSILIYYLLHFVCKISVVETFQKLKLDRKNEEILAKKMNAFFLFCIIISICFCLGTLLSESWMSIMAINKAYESVPADLANEIANQIMIDYENNITSKICSTIIIQSSLVVSFFSIIHRYPKLVKEYNKAEKTEIY